MILLVDDEEELLEELFEMLRRHHIPSIAESNPCHAVCLVAERPEVNLIIADWHMPLLVGLGLMAQVWRDLHVCRSCRFIIMTGHEGDTGSQLAIEHGASLVLRKPFGETELVDALERVGWSA